MKALTSAVCVIIMQGASWTYPAGVLALVQEL